MSNQPSPGPQFSPDGKWWWDGARWVPAQPPPRQAEPQAPYQAPQAYRPPGASPPAGGHAAAGPLPQPQPYGPGGGPAPAPSARTRRTGWIVLAVVAVVLLVPAVIVGILAVTGMLPFLNSGERAALDTLKSALTSAGQAEEMYKDLTGSYTGELSLLETVAGLAKVPGVDIRVISADADGFCLTGTNEGSVFYYSSEAGLSSEPCT